VLDWIGVEYNCRLINGLWLINPVDAEKGFNIDVRIGKILLAFRIIGRKY